LKSREVQVPTARRPRLWGVSLRVGGGELVCVVGPNGAGKSTLINVIAGLHRARAAACLVDGQDITQLAPHRFCAAASPSCPRAGACSPA
jgi:branched-chain amino acid transport system ATP-binding protein